MRGIVDDADTVEDAQESEHRSMSGVTNVVSRTICWSSGSSWLYQRLSALPRGCGPRPGGPVLSF